MQGRASEPVIGRVFVSAGRITLAAARASFESRLAYLALFALASLSALTASAQNGPRGATIDNFRAARAIVQRSLDAYGELPVRLSAGECRFTIDGEVWVDDFDGPRESRLKGIWGERIVSSSFWDATLAVRTWVTDEPPGLKGQTLVVGSEVFETAVGAPFGRRLEGQEKRSALVRAHSVLPHRILERIDARAASLRSLGRVEFGERAFDLLSYVDVDGLARSLYIDAETALLARVEWLHHEEGRGDCLDESDFSDYESIGGLMVPKHVMTVTRRGTERLVLLGQISTVQFGRRALASDFYLPEDRVAGEDAAERCEAWARLLTRPDERARPRPETYELARGVALFVWREAQAKVVVARFADHSVAIGAPGDSELGRDLYDEVARLWPEQPVRTVVVQRHAGRASGGLRGLIETGVSVVMRPSERDGLQSFWRRPRTVRPDGQEVLKIEPEVELVEGRLRIADDGQELVLIDAAAHEPPLGDSLWVWLPRAKVLCLAEFVEALGRPGAGAESELRLLAAGIDVLGLDVVGIVQPWPADGVALVAGPPTLDGEPAPPSPLPVRRTAPAPVDPAR